MSIAWLRVRKCRRRSRPKGCCSSQAPRPSYISCGTLRARSPANVITRRDLVRSGAGLAAAVAVRARAASAQQGAPNLGANRLVLLGTRGGPAIRTGYRPSPSANLIVYNGIPYVIDTGYGVSFKLVEAKFPLALLRYVFI